MSFPQFLSAVQNAINRENGTDGMASNQTGAVARARTRINLCITFTCAGAQLRSLLHINNPDASHAVYEVIPVPVPFSTAVMSNPAASIA